MMLNPTTFPSPSRNAESIPSLGPLWDESRGLPTLLGGSERDLSHSLQQKWRGTPGRAPPGHRSLPGGWKEML